MKKWIIFFVFFVVVVSGLLQLYKNYEIVWDVVQVVENEEEVSLNNFLERYKNNEFSKIELKDAVDLIWYVYVSSWDAKSMMTLKKTYTEHVFDTYSTKKPMDTSLSDLGISLTWSVLVDVKYTTIFWRNMTNFNIFYCVHIVF